MYKYLILALALSAVAFATEEEDQPMQHQPVEQPKHVVQTVPVAGGWPGVYGQHVYGQQVYNPWGGHWAGQWAYPGVQYVVQQPAVQQVHQVVKPAPITHTTKTEVKYTVQQPAVLAPHAGLVYPQHQVVRPVVATQTHKLVSPVVSTHNVVSSQHHVVSSPVAQVVAAPALTHAYNTYPWTYPGWNGGLYGYPVVGGAYIPGWKKK